MAGVKWIQGSPQRLVSAPSRFVGKFRPRLYARMKQVIDEAVEDAKRFTASRPSAKSGKSGRIETGDMMDAIVGRVYQNAEESIIGDFGFLDRQEFYFFLQTDEGFRNWRSGEFIEPTFALRDAAIIAFNKLLDRKF